MELALLITAFVLFVLACVPRVAQSFMVPAGLACQVLAHILTLI